MIILTLLLCALFTSALGSHYLYFIQFLLMKKETFVVVNFSAICINLKNLYAHQVDSKTSPTCKVQIIFSQIMAI